MKRIVFSLAVLSLVICSHAGPAEDMVRKTGVHGGVAVALGVDSPALLMDLHHSGAFVVHGLDRDPAKVAAVRKAIQTKGLWGPVTVERLRGESLPYVDNLVNLVVQSSFAKASEDQSSRFKVQSEEVQRVLSPGGVSVIINHQSSIINSVVKPRDARLDDWPHYLNKADNNAVAQDTVIDFPRGLQWIGGPLYTRHHDHMSSVSAVVSDGARIYTILDEASAASIEFPPDWKLVARDAFNGKRLWERSIDRWAPHLWPLKMGPAQLPRRLVAHGGKVYVTLDIEGPVEELDAKSGKTLRVLEGAERTDEMLCIGDTLLCLTRKQDYIRSDSYASIKDFNRYIEHWDWEPTPNTLAAVDLKSGKTRWSVDSVIVPLSPAIGDGRVYFHDTKGIRCLDLQSGQPIWKAEDIRISKKFPAWYGVILVVRDGKVFFSGGNVNNRWKMKADNMAHSSGSFDLLYALDAETGEPLWTAEHLPSGYRSPEDLFVIGDKVWFGNYAAPRGPGTGRTVALDTDTGAIVKDFMHDVEVPWFHHRCYRAKATVNYLLTSRMGIEFVDLESEHWTPHHWTRGTCLYGIMPANGMLYVPPSPCSCHSESKLPGFSVLHPRVLDLATGAAAESERLTVGTSATRTDTDAHGPEWPTYRGDSARSGATTMKLPAVLRSAWTTDLDGELTPPVIADGKVFVSIKDQNTLVALDAKTGKETWRFCVGGSVDSPPTVVRVECRVSSDKKKSGASSSDTRDRTPDTRHPTPSTTLALFGSRDGHVYALDAATGTMVWRYRAAPMERNLLAFERLESLWPVHGSVLTMSNEVYCTAGRSAFLDGGLRLLKLDAATGRKIAETVIDDKIPETGENAHSMAWGKTLPVSRPDILSSDGDMIYMRSLRLTPELERINVNPDWAGDQVGEGLHLFSPTGFLDDTWWHRTYWIYGRAAGQGASVYYGPGKIVPSGKILVVDDDKVYGFGRQWQYYRWSSSYEYRLFAAKKEPEVLRTKNMTPVKDKTKAVSFAPAFYKTPEAKFVTDWERTDLPILARGLLSADRVLAAAGPPVFVNEAEAADTHNAPNTQERIRKQQEAMEGQHGGQLLLISKTDGKTVQALPLDGIPVFDGLAAAHGNLFMSRTDGRMQCFAE